MRHHLGLATFDKTGTAQHELFKEDDKLCVLDGKENNSSGNLWTKLVVETSAANGIDISIISQWGQDTGGTEKKLFHIPAELVSHFITLLTHGLEK